jgi:hypothetical protein
MAKTGSLVSVMEQLLKKYSLVDEERTCAPPAKAKA